MGEEDFGGGSRVSLNNLPDAADVQLRPWAEALDNLIQLFLLFAQVPVGRSPAMGEPYPYQDGGELLKRLESAALSPHSPTAYSAWAISASVPVSERSTQLACR